MTKRLQWIIAFAVFFLAPALLGAGPVPPLPTPPNAAMIYNPGTGDYAGFRIVVNADGRAIAIDGAGHTATQLQNDLVEKFFEDLSSAGPLAQLSAKPCTDQVSDTSTTTVEVNSAITISWKGQHSPPLLCATDARAQKLLLDATSIQHALYVQAYRKRNLLTYGVGYAQSSGGPILGYIPDSRFTFDQFYGGRFYNYGLTFDRFTMDRFSTGLTQASPFTGAPYTGSPFTSSPASSLSSTSPYAALPYANPFVSAPYSSPFTGSPFSSSGFGSSPYSSTPVYSTSHP